MTNEEAAGLLRPAVPDGTGAAWADLGAGTGVFTRALAGILGPTGHILAVDADAGAIRPLRKWAEGGGHPSIRILHADITRPLDLPPLDGVLMANVLHFIPDAQAAVSLAASYLRPGGRLVLMEYEGRRPNPWVPYPVSIARFGELAAAAGLAAPEVVARRPSAFGGDLYVAVAARPG